MGREVVARLAQRRLAENPALDDEDVEIAVVVEIKQGNAGPSARIEVFPRHAVEVDEVETSLCACSVNKSPAPGFAGDPAPVFCPALGGQEDSCKPMTAALYRTGMLTRRESNFRFTRAFPARRHNKS